jgi:hypothetical protein
MFFYQFSSQKMAPNVLAYINSRMDKSDCAQPHRIKYPRTVANGLAGIENAVVKCLLFPIGNEFASFTTDKNLTVEFGRTWGLFVEV